VTTKPSEKKINEVDISQKNWIITTISICSRKDQKRTFLLIFRIVVGYNNSYLLTA